MPVSALAPKELKPFREREPSWRRQSPSRSGSLSSGYRWFESISLQRRVLCEPDSLDQDGENLPSGFKLASSNSRRRGLEGVSMTDDLWRLDATGRRRNNTEATLRFAPAR